MLPGWLRNRDQYKVLSRKTRTILKRDKERYAINVAEDVEGHSNTNDFQHTYGTMKMLRSKSNSFTNAIRTADGCLVSDTYGQMARWAEYIRLITNYSLYSWKKFFTLPEAFENKSYLRLVTTRTISN